MHTGIYPGTFDPVTLGHGDIIRRAAHIADRVLVAVADNDVKKPLFSIAERVDMLAHDINALRAAGELPQGVEVQAVSFSGLLVDFARKENAEAVIRGLRAVSDFDYEMQMAGVNARLYPELQTVFLAASESRQFIASRLVKEIAKMNGPLNGMVSDYVREKLRNRCGNGVCV